ncbi:MAG: hypothetical protein KAU90_10365 [Sulfurovaceae bacterium]|nr:hypothetical protein [Sulfurovaceae bacterium]
MYIYAFSNYHDIVIDKLSDKKTLLTKRFSRTDNFIDLALLGAQISMQNIEIDPCSSIYLASRNGNINSTIKVLEVIFRQNRLPMPFNFLNSVNQSTLFFVAQNFNIKGKTLFVDKFESALVQAFIDVQNSKTVLIGAVEEAISDLKLHQKRFGSDKIEEYSRWLVISPKLIDREPLAHIYNFKLTTENQIETKIDELFSFLGSRDEKFDFIGENLTFSVKKSV